MKQQWLSAAIAAILILLVCACGTGAGYRDGTYTATADDYDETGFRDSVTVTVSGGKIAGVEWNAYDEQGRDKKTLSQNGEYDLTVAGAKSQWHEQAASMEQALIDRQDPSKIKVLDNGKTDSVSGVSITVSAFVRLAGQALADAGA